MIEVLSSFNCAPNTFFVAVDLMDSFMAKSSRKLETKDVHLLGVTAMLVSSKMEEIIPFKVSTVVEKMTHNKLRAKEVVECELEFLQALGFNTLSSPSLFVAIEMLMTKLSLFACEINSDIQKVAIYVSKMAMHDYSILTKFSIKYLAASCLYICFKIIEQVHKDFRIRSLVEKMKSFLELDETTFYKSSELVLSLAKNFETLFPYAKNLLKFDAFTLEEGEQKSPSTEK